MQKPITETEINAILSTVRLTSKQRRTLEAYLKERTAEKTALALGVTAQTVRRSITGSQKRALAAGINQLVPEGLTVKGVSTYYTTKKMN